MIVDQDKEAHQEYPEPGVSRGEQQETSLTGPLLKRSGAASAYPRKASQRGMYPVRSASVEVAVMNAPAILIA